MFKIKLNTLKKELLEDDLKTFKIENFQFYKKYKAITNLGICIKFENCGKIAYYLAKKEGVTYDDYKLLLKIMKMNIKNKNKYDQYQKMFLNIFLYNKANIIEISKIIDGLVKISEWMIIDYLHIFGHRANKSNSLIFNYPKILLNKLKNYGYDIEIRFIKEMLDNNNNNIVNYINKNNFNKWKIEIIKTRSDKCLKNIIENGNVTFEDIQKTDCINLACRYVNVELIKYFIKNNIPIKKENINELIGIGIIIKRRYRKKRFYMKTNAIREQWYKGKFEKDIIEIIDLLGNKLRINNNEKLWELILKNNFYELYSKMISSGYKVKLNNGMKYGLILNIIEKDDEINFKKLIEHEVIKIKQGANLMLTNFMDMALRYNSKKLIKYLKEELHATCSKNINTILNYISYNNINNKNNINLIHNLDNIGYPIKNNLLIFACKRKNLEWIKYLNENKKLKITQKHLYLCLSENSSEQILKYILSKVGNYNKNNLIDKILSYKKLSRQKSNNIKIIKYIKQKLGGTASAQSLEYAIYLNDFTVLRYLHSVFNFPITIKLLEYTIRYRLPYHFASYVSGEICIYLLKNIKEKINNELVEEISRMGYNTFDVKILEFLEKEHNFKPKQADFNSMCIEYGCRIEMIDYFLKYDEMIIYEHLIDSMISNRNMVLINHIYDNYKNKVDFDNIFTLKKINTFVALEYANYEFFVFINEKIKRKITPYTVETYLKYIGYHRDINILSYLMNIINVMTATIKNLINLKVKKGKKKLLSKYKLFNDYEPNINEKPDENILIINNWDENEVYDDDNENKKIDEVELALIEADNTLKQ